MIQAKLNAAQQELVETYLFLVPQVLKYELFFSHTDVEMNYEDLVQIGNLALCKAALNYDPARPFPPFAKTVIRNALFDYARRVRLQYEQFCNFSEELEATLSYSYEYPEAEYYLKYLEAQATGIHKKGLHALRLKLAGYTAIDISKRFGVTPSAVGNWIRHSKHILQNNTALQEFVS